MISAGDLDACQLERLVKLLYHFLAYLNKEDDLERFKWYSKMTLQFCRLERRFWKDKAESSEKETVKIFEKIFEMHWKLASDKTKNKSDFCKVLSIRMQGLQYLLHSTKDILKFGKYFENSLLTFLQEGRNQSTEISGDISLSVIDVICYLGDNFVSNQNQSAAFKAGVIYIVLLSFKLLIIYGKSKEFLEQLTTENLCNQSKPLLNSLLLPLIEAYRTHLLLRKLPAAKVGKELCKQAKVIKQYLQDFEVIHEELLKSKVLIVNPKIVVIYDIIKVLMTFQEKLCWEVLIHLSKLAVTLKRHIKALVDWLCADVRNGSTKKIPEEQINVLKMIATKWYSFVCWCLQTFQSWLSPKEKSVGDAKCSCVTKSVLKR